MKIKTIALDLRFWRRETGGLGRYARNLLTELLAIDQVNHYTAVITPRDEPEFDLKAANLTKKVVPIAPYSLREQTTFNNWLKRQNFDLVHFANFNHPLTYRRPFVVTVQDLIMDLYPTGHKRQSWLRRLGYNKVISDCRRANQVIVPSQSTKNDLISRRRFPPEKIVVIPLGADHHFRPASAAKIRQLKSRLRLPDQYLLFVSRWEAYKGLPNLLLAHRQLSAKFPQLGLVIVGRPDRQNPPVAKLVEEAKSAGQPIVTPGFVGDDDLPILYSGAAVMVHPSLYEGFGLMILEAFACGTPVVATDVSSLPEVVGQAGLLVPPNDPPALAAAIAQILTDQRLADSLRDKGLERVKQYSWRQTAERTLAVYQKVLDQES